jgi:hypothetical protein
LFNAHNDSHRPFPHIHRYDANYDGRSHTLIQKDSTKAPPTMTLRKPVGIRAKNQG